MDILISSLGLNAEIVEEALGLFNFQQHDFYAGHANAAVVAGFRDSVGIASGHGVDEVWLIATDKPHTTDRSGREHPSAREDFCTLKSREGTYGVRMRMFVLEGVQDIDDDREARQYHDLALRTVALAQAAKGEGRLYVSLACGRKTMSADLQDAVYCFGCDLLLHILGNSKTDAYPVSLGSVTRNEALTVPAMEGMEGDIVSVRCGDCGFLHDIEQQKAMSQHFYTTYYLKQEDKNNFHILYTLPPSKIDELKCSKIGITPENKETELAYLPRLPKTELHCHLGGVLSPAEMTEVAGCYESLIDAERKKNTAYGKWLASLPGFIAGMRRRPDNWKVWYNGLAEQYGVHKSLIVAPFLLSFRNCPEKLDRLIFNRYTDECVFRQIGITSYEGLGDLQGSALLCNEEAIRKTVQILLANCIRENVRYVEVRCSPVNYACGTLTPQEVLRTIIEELDRERGRIKSSVIIIASRHNDRAKIEESIRLVRDMRGDRLFAEYFRGFDLAGAEDSREAKEFRELFLDVMRDCYNITIHAGETVSSESIWQAVYHLNAERIGHGLTLIENNDLANKFLERGIGIEMCPSSNFQIVGFRDNYHPRETYSLNDYPLKEYLRRELKVSVNTDDPGISRTDMTHELLKAARMTRGGLSKWDILQVLCNGFRTAFYPYKGKKELMAGAEKELAGLIEQGLL